MLPGGIVAAQRIAALAALEGSPLVVEDGTVLLSVGPQDISRELADLFVAGVGYVRSLVGWGLPLERQRDARGHRRSFVRWGGVA